VILQTHWSYDDLNDAPADVVEAVIELLREQAAAYEQRN
jgi:hypothetical protein